MSIVPNASCAFATSSSHAPSTVRSPAWTAVSPSISPAACSATSPSMSLTRTRAPSLASSSAVARPIPRAEPVMIAALPSSSPIRSVLLSASTEPAQLSLDSRRGAYLGRQPGRGTKLLRWRYRIAGERLEAGVPGAGRVDVDVRLLHLLDDPLEQLAAVGERRLELVGAALAKAPVEVELALEDAEIDLVLDRRRPAQEAGAERLAERDRVVALRHRRQEAPVELDRLELDLAGDALHRELVGTALDRLDVERRHHAREVRDVGLDEHRAGQHRLREEASLLALVGVARGAPELVGELPRQPVGAAGAERLRATLRVQPADLLVAKVALLRDPPHDLSPCLCFFLRAHA